MQILIALNFGFVLIFGISLALSFSNISFKENPKDYFIIFFIFGIIQINAYLFLGDVFLFKSYPLLIHLPLFLLLRYYYKNNVFICAISVLSAYLFCTPRKWFGTFVSYFWDYSIEISYIVQISVTIPLLLIIIKFVSPYVARLRFEDDKVLKLFISVPLLYYVIEYCLTVYTDLLYQGGAVIVEFMDAAVVIIYFIFSIIYLKTLYEKKEIEVEQTVLKIMANQSQYEIEALRQSQKQAAIYRHDLRHHLNYLNTCISQNKLKDAMLYIENTCQEIDNVKVTRYCENESLNLILSAYIAKAKNASIKCEVKITTSDFKKITIPDLCSLLSNAIENAMNACDKITDNKERFLKLRMYSKNNKLCIDIRNSYNTEPVFNQGLPVTDKKDHGIGTKSMIYIVEKNKGVYQFFAKDGIFTFQVII